MRNSPPPPPGARHRPGDDAAAPPMTPPDDDGFRPPGADSASTMPQGMVMVQAGRGGVARSLAVQGGGGISEVGILLISVYCLFGRNGRYVAVQMLALIQIITFEGIPPCVSICLLHLGLNIWALYVMYHLGWNCKL